MAGFLIQLAGAANAVWADAGSYAVSVVSLLAIRKPEPEPKPSRVDGRQGFWHELWEGVQVVLGNSTLWKIAGCTATSNLGSNILFAVFLICAYRLLQLGPAVIGVIFAAGSIGGLLGALTASPVTKRVGLGLTLFLTITLGGLFFFLVPLSHYGLAVPFLVVSTFGFSYGSPVYNIGQVSLRQAITPDRVQGRMNATMRTIVWGTLPIGSFLGGVLGTAVGIIPTLWIGAVISTLAGVWILAGPIRLKTQPEPTSNT